MPAKTNSNKDLSNKQINSGSAPSTPAATNTRAPLGRSYSYREGTSTTEPVLKSVPEKTGITKSIKRGQTLNTIPDSVLKQRYDKSGQVKKPDAVKKQASITKCPEQSLSSTHSLSSSYSSLNGIPENPNTLNVSKIISKI